jgi:SAM-dependent methyltransferase
MIHYIKKRCRSWARSHLLTFNTIRYRVEFPRILEAFKQIGKQNRVFDGGAGGGQMLRQVYESGYCHSGVGLEFDPNLYQILVSNFADISALTCQRGSLTEVPHPDESFDCAMTTQVLEHIVDHEKAASELARIVKKGGHLIVSVPHPPEPFPNVGHVREGYTEADLVALFPNPDFELLHTGYSLTRPTVKRVIFSEKLPLGGKFMPVAWADRETKLTDAERKAQTPFAITCLFRKC